MEVGAAFLLLVAIIVIGGLGFGVFAISARLRRRQLDPKEDRVEPHRRGDPSDSERKPEHLRVSNEQHTHFVQGR